VHDPLTLVNHVDGILLVARLHWTTKDATRRTLRLLGQVSSRILGVVLTGGERTPGYYGDPDYRHYGRPKPKEEVRS
jgi:Mrp family chromosome partitioning ATPase